MVETMMRVLNGLALLVATVGMVDAIEDDWDHFANFAAIAVLLVVAMVLRRLRAPSVEVRPDLADWLRDEAARTDDTPGRIANRLFAAYRSGRSPSSEAGSAR